MADAASRRAARRKKILENSDDRMKKLFGTYGKDEERAEQKEPAKDESTGQLNVDDLPISRTPSPDTPSSDVGSFSSLPESDQVTENETTPSSSNSGLRLRSNHNSNLTDINQSETEKSDRHETKRIEPGTEALPKVTDRTDPSPKRTDVSPKSCAKPEASDMSESDDVNTAHQHGIRKLRAVLFFLVAVIVRLVLISGVGILYFQSAVLPFILTECSFLMYLSSTPEGLVDSYGKQGGSLLTSALMLSGIQPKIITTYTNISLVFSTAFEDFALYFFSFIMTHWLVQCVG